jgi:hypothetical protein
MRKHEHYEEKTEDLSDANKEICLETDAKKIECEYMLISSRRTE